VTSQCWSKSNTSILKNYILKKNNKCDIINVSLHLEFVSPYFEVFYV